VIKHLVSRQLRLLQSFVSVFLVLVIISLFQQTYADEHQKIEGISNKNPGADLWRNIRQRDQELLGSLKSTSPGISQVKSVDSNILINEQGEIWAKFRMEQIIKYGMMLLGSILVIIFLFYLLRGRVNIEGGLSGKMVHRFNSYERVLHWVLALVFLFLAITGLILLFGRSLLIPVMGHELFALFASSSKEGHNLFGPIFLVSIVLMLIRFVKKNIYAKGDLTWLLKGGGMIGKSHVTGGFFNMGEKSWYWMVILIGLLVSISGLILVSPNFGQGRIIMELSHVVHAAGALLLITVSLGHMYLGSVGSEGSLEAMKTGYVDISWAEAHHDRWAKECNEKQMIVSAEDYAKLQGRIPIKTEATVSTEKSL